MKKNCSQNFAHVLLLFNCQSSEITFCGFLKNFLVAVLQVGKLLIVGRFVNCGFQGCSMVCAVAAPKRFDCAQIEFRAPGQGLSTVQMTHCGFLRSQQQCPQQPRHLRDPDAGVRTYKLVYAPDFSAHCQCTHETPVHCAHDGLDILTLSRANAIIAGTPLWAGNFLCRAEKLISSRALQTDACTVCIPFTLGLGPKPTSHTGSELSIVDMWLENGGKSQQSRTDRQKDD